MAENHLSPQQAPSAEEQHLFDIFALQQQAFARDRNPSAAQRKTHLSALKRQLQRYQDLLAEAVSADFGHRSHAESKMFDILGSVLEANHAMSHLARWMKPSRRSTEWLFKTNRLEVRYQPKGIVGVIVPWNFPLYLALGPLVASLAAGNRVMIKMAETTPNTNEALRRMLAEIFPEDLVAVFGGEISDPNAFTSLPFDHIVFTGSPAVGRIVMRTAAANLTPVTLELGGKSPALVLRDYPLADAARRIAHGKCANGGQICVSPDYALVPEEEVPAFVQAVQAAFQSFYGGKIAENPDYTSLINDRHYARTQALLEDAKAKGASVTVCGSGHARQTPLYVVTGCTPDMRLLEEEIFGPILPVLAYKTVDDALNFVNARPRPLALYVFTHDKAARESILGATHSGGVTVNDWGWHVVNHDAPFGGIGNSGMGNYHGQEGFRELSHARTVFIRHRFFPTQLFHPPFGSWVQRMSLKLFLGEPDPRLKKE